MVLIKCDTCGKEIKRTPWNISHYKHHFCNRRCAGVFAGKVMKPRNNESKEVADDILAHIDKRQLKFWITRKEIKKGIFCKKTGELYENHHVIAGGVLYLVRRKMFKKVSQLRYEIYNQEDSVVTDFNLETARS